MRSILTLAILLSLSTAHAQWELMTAIKTRSEIEGLVMVNDAVGYAVDDPMGAILRTRDGGSSWERMAVDNFNNPKAIFMWDEFRGIVVGESGSVKLTTDGFETIAGSTDAVIGQLNCVFFVNDTLGWAGGNTGKIFRSIDGGESWTLTNSGQSTNNYFTSIQFLDTEVGYASCYSGGKVLKSTDGGLNWQNVGPMDQTVLVMDMHFFDTEVGVGVGTAGDVIRTVDGGATWDSIPSNTSYSMNDLDVVGDVMVACGWWGRTIRSIDAGLTWTEIQSGNIEHRSVALRPNGTGLMGTDGRIMATDDMGLSWSMIVEGTFHTLLNKVSFMDVDTGVAIGWATTGGFENGMVRTTDGGRHWYKAGGGGLGVHLNADGSGCTGGGSGSFSRTDDGFNTRTPATGPNMAIRCTWTFDANTHIVGGGAVNGGIYRTTNAGLAWTRVLDLGNITISDLWFVDALHGRAVGEYGDSYRTSDGGVTWEADDSGGGHTVFFLDELHGWTKNFRTVDGGENWIMMGGTPQTTRSIFFIDPDTGYAVSYSGQTVRSTDGGESWENVLPEIANAMIGDASYVDGYIIAVGNNGDVFRGQVACPNIAMVPPITENDGTLCTSTDGMAQWYFNGEVIPDGNTPCIDPDLVGSYHVVVTDELGCPSQPSLPVEFINTGTSTTVATSTSALFPNPASQNLRIQRPEGSPASLAVLDAQGRIILTERISGSHIALDISSFVIGLYTIRIASSTRVETFRLVKE